MTYPPQKIYKELLTKDLQNALGSGTVYNTQSTYTKSTDAYYLFRTANDFYNFEEKTEIVNNDLLISEDSEDEYAKKKIKISTINEYIRNNNYDLYSGIEVKTSNFTAVFQNTYIIAGTSNIIEVTLPSTINDGGSLRIINRETIGFQINIPANHTLYLGNMQYTNSKPFIYSGDSSIGTVIEILAYNMPAGIEWFAIADLNFAFWAETPPAPNSFGIAGQIAYDDDNIYICTTNSHWKRTGIANYTI